MIELFFFLQVLLSSPCDTYSNQVYCQTNAHRVDTGLGRLKYSDSAEQVAKARAEHLCQTNTFTHDGWTNFVTFEYERVGENLAKGFQTPQEAVEALKASPSHLENIEGDWTHLGVYTEPCDGNPVSVQIFMTNK